MTPSTPEKGREADTVRERAELLRAKAEKWHDEETLGDATCEYRELEVHAFIAGYSAALSASPDSLHQQIMNLPADPKVLAQMEGSPKGFYLLGHRDARHAAAELVCAAGVPAEAESGWRPIETAPKDGTTLLGWVVAGPDEWGIGGFTAPSLIRWDRGFKSSICERKPSWIKEWRGEVTHWMPLPAPPASPLSAEEEPRRDAQSTNGGECG